MNVPVIEGLSRLPLLCAALLLTACAGSDYPDGVAPVQVTPADRAELLSGSAFGVAAKDSVAPVDLLGVDEDMRYFLQQRVPEDTSKHQRVNRILQGLLDDGLNLQYHNFKTYTAAETFSSRDGNCMSFTNLFVALGREAGLKVYYQEVEVPPSWSTLDGSWMYSRHINALVRLYDEDRVVDFNLDEFDHDYHRSRLSDQQALARFHNNLGVHWMGQSEAHKSFLHYREALRLDPATSYFWTNLGSLYRRGGDDVQAEKAYLVAIDIDREPVAMSNLARLYRHQGNEQLASYYEARVQSFRRKNPFYLYHLAQESYARGEYAESERQLRRAIVLNDGEHEFYRLLGLTYIQLGKPEAAEQRFRQAAELANDPDAEARYRRKLELMANH